MNKIDLNSDLGEGFGDYKIGNDEDILKSITSANVACGFHAGDAVIMEKTVKLAKKYGVSVGAHPGFPDILGFGRRNIAASTDEVKAYVKYQIGALMAFCTSNEVKMQHVKPHGALYNMAAKDINLANAIARAIYEVDKNLIFMGLSGSKMIEAAQNIGLKSSSEVFADRAYNNDGSLVARNLEGAVIHNVDQCIERVIKMVKENKVTTITGDEINISPTTICVHGDTKEAIEFVENIRRSLIENGVKLCSLSN